MQTGACPTVSRTKGQLSQWNSQVWVFIMTIFFWHKVDIHLDLIKLVSHFSDRWIFEFSQRAIWASGGLGLHYH